MERRKEVLNKKASLEVAGRGPQQEQITGCGTKPEPTQGETPFEVTSSASPLKVARQTTSS